MEDSAPQATTSVTDQLATLGITVLTEDQVSQVRRRAMRLWYAVRCLGFGAMVSVGAGVIVVEGVLWTHGEHSPLWLLGLALASALVALSGGTVLLYQLFTGRQAPLWEALGYSSYVSRHHVPEGIHGRALQLIEYFHDQPASVFVHFLGGDPLLYVGDEGAEKRHYVGAWLLGRVLY